MSSELKSCLARDRRNLAVRAQQGRRSGAQMQIRRLLAYQFAQQAFDLFERPIIPDGDAWSLSA